MAQQNIQGAVLTPAALNAAYMAVGLITNPGLLASQIWQMAYSNPGGTPFKVARMPIGKMSLEETGTQTDTTSTASFYNGVTYKEYSPGDVMVDFKWESEWRADSPVFPPQLRTNKTYGWVAYQQDPSVVGQVAPQIVASPIPFGTLTYCAVFAAIVKKNPMDTDLKTGITTWKPDLQVTGPVVYIDGNGNLVL